VRQLPAARPREIERAAGLDLVAASIPSSAATEPVISVDASRDIASLNAVDASRNLSPSEPALPRAQVSPPSPGRYKLQLTIGAETLEKMRLARDMLGHAIPSGDDADVLDRAFTALLTELAKKKFAETPRPRTLPSTAQGKTAPPAPAASVRKPAPRTASAAVKRAVWMRDLGRCAFVGSAGRRCNERRFVEFHHVDPYALGGEASVDGIQLRCRRHNDYEGRLYFGERRNGRELVPEQVRLSAADSIS
jgi:hypothetical protein